MSAAFNIPKPIVQFPGGAGLVTLPSRYRETPAEGRRYIPINIAWPGDGSTYQVNVNGLSTQPLSQIIMLDVDNSMSGADVTFYFPDSSDTLVIPAESGGLFPVFTGALLMYVAAPAALASDVTRFRILNYGQEPVALPPPQLSSIATGLGLVAAGTTALLGPTVSGTLTGYSVNVALESAGGGVSKWQGTLKDHATGNVIDQASATVLPGAAYSGPILNVTGIAVRFSGGLDFVIANSGSAWTSQTANVSLRYRTP